MVCLIGSYLVMHVWLIFRGEKFRTEFSHLDEVRSIIPETVRVMALTETTTKTTRRFIIKSLNEEVGYKREGNSPNFRDFSRLATATNIVLPLYKPKNSLNFFYNT